MLPYKKFIGSITVRHLLEHTVGVWSNSGSDPMWRPFKLTHKQLISNVINDTRMLQGPGRRYAYSNFGYCILGRVIEQITGMTYENYVRKTILKPCGITGMRVARNTVKQRKPNEVIYYGQKKRNPYGENVTRMDSHGGWIASPIDLVRFAVRVDKSNRKRDILKPETLKLMTTTPKLGSGYAKGWFTSSSDNYFHGGRLTGNASFLEKTADGLCIAFITNSRSYEDSFSGARRQLVLNILANVKNWPSYDLF